MNKSTHTHTEDTDLIFKSEHRHRASCSSCSVAMAINGIFQSLCGILAGPMYSLGNDVQGWWKEAQIGAKNYCISTAKYPRRNTHTHGHRVRANRRGNVTALAVRILGKLRH